MAAPLHAATIPDRPEGPVLDQADLLSPEGESRIDARLRDYNAQTGRSIIVVTLNSLEGEPVDLFAREIAESWGVSGVETEEGVLLLIAPNERQMWITTARGVQDRLTDITAGRIYRDVLRPAFRAGDFEGGISTAVDEMIARLEMSPADARAIAEAEAAAERTRQNQSGFPIGLLVWGAIIFFFFILPMMRGRGRRRRYRGKGREFGDTVSDIILWEVGSAVVRGALSGGDDWGGGGSSFGGGGGFGGFGGGGGGFNGGGAGGGW